MDNLLRNMIRQLNVALVNMKVYAADHPTTDAAIKRGHDALTQILEHRDRLSLGLVDETLIMDESPVDQSDALMAKFIEELKMREIDGLVFYSGISQEEFKVFLRCINYEPERIMAEGGAQKLFESQGLSHVSANEVKYGKINENPGGGEGLEEAIIAAFLMGRMPVLDGNQKAFLSLLEEDPATFGAMMNAGLLKMGETGRGEAELARCANQGMEQVSRFLEAQSEGSKNHSTIMAEIIFSMNPETQASLYRLRAAGEDYPQNSMDALVLDFKDDEVIRLICNVYRGGLRSPEMLARVAKRVLPTKERKEQIAPDLGQEVMGSGMEKATWEAVKDEILWDVYSLSEKIDHLVSRSRFGKADLERVKELSSDLKGSKNRGEIRKILKYLVVALEGDDPEVRGLVADYLPSFYDPVRNSGQFRNADVLFLKKLIARLKRETEESVQNSILVSLASIMKAEILQDHFHAPARAVITLSRMGYLLRLIQTSDSLVSQEVTDHVIAALAGQDQVRRNEASILLKLSGRAVLESVLFALEREENPETRERLMVVVRSMGTEITGEIIHRLADGRWFVVQTALQILGEIGDRTVSSDLLISSAYHEDIRVRNEAIQTLGKLRSRGAIRMLCDLLTDKDEEIRFLALRTLGDTGDKMAVPHILPFLQKKRKVKGQKSDILRQTAIEVLGRIGDPEAIPILLDLLRSRAVSKKGGEVIRKRLVEALGAIRDPELEEVFQSVMEKDTDVAVREAARRAILNLESPEKRAAL